MYLNDIKGSYGAIFGLGHNCLVGIQLRKNNLRPYAGVIDWVASPSLPDVTRLLSNRFSGFMEPRNLEIVGYATDRDLLVTDKAYTIHFNHDFKTDANTLTNLSAFPLVKQKYDRRIARELEKFDSGDKLLFIRTEGTFEEAHALERALSKVVKGDFHILLINHTNVTGIVETNWQLEKVCTLELPNTKFGEEEMFNINDAFWRAILQEFQIK